MSAEATLPSIRPGSLRAWLLATRPATLTAAIVPVLVGGACAYATGKLRVDTTLAALLGAVLIQIATNFANDVFDHEKGADTKERLGPTRATQSGLLSAREVRRGMLVAIALAVLVGAYLASAAGPVVVLIGVVSIASGVAYTGGPYPLGYNGLGDVFVFVFFGVVAVAGTAFVACGAVTPLAWIASIPVGAVATAVLVVNNVRDRATDVVAGKRTLAVRFGKAFGVAEYRALLAVAYVTPVALVAASMCSKLVLAPLATAPLAVKLARDVAAKEGRPLNATLASTAKLLLAFGALFALGIAAGK